MNSDCSFVQPAFHSLLAKQQGSILRELREIKLWVRGIINKGGGIYQGISEHDDEGQRHAKA